MSVGETRPRTAPAAERRFLEALDRAYLEAASEGEVTRRLTLAGRVAVELRVAGGELARSLLPALAWIDGGSEPEWEVRAFAGGRLPRCPWPLAPRPRGEVTGGGAAVACVLLPDVPALSILDREQRRGWYWTADPRRLPAWQRAAPLLRLVTMLLDPEPLLLTHAGAVGDGRRALLLVGRGGSGKSTTTLAGLAAGLEVFGDDYVLVDPAAPEPAVAALYASAKVDAASLARLELAGVSLAPGPRETTGKAVVALPDRARPRRGASRPLAAILLPEIAGATTAPEPVSPARALRALAPSSIFQLPFAGGAQLAGFAELVRRVPAYRFPVGPDLAGVAGALVRHLATRGAC